MEKLIKAQFGDLLWAVMALQAQLEEVQKELATVKQNPATKHVKNDSK